jgi:hypothetical protein
MHFSHQAAGGDSNRLIHVNTLIHHTYCVFAIVCLSLPSYDTDNASANANGMHVKVAALAAENEDYKRAIEIYEKVSKNSLDNSSLRWSVKDYLFRALLCQFVLAARKGVRQHNRQ